MAGDYIPWQKGLIRKPEVAQIARMTGLDNFSTAARLMCVWEWIEEVTENGCIEGVDATSFDSVAGKEGFAEAMQKTRPHPWLILDGTGATIPNFERWNGMCAKRRIREAERKRRSRGEE